MIKINDKLLRDFAKDHQDTHKMVKPGKHYEHLELQNMSVYNELVNLFRAEEGNYHGFESFVQNSSPFQLYYSLFFT